MLAMTFHVTPRATRMAQAWPARPAALPQVLGLKLAVQSSSMLWLGV